MSKKEITTPDTTKNLLDFAIGDSVICGVAPGWIFAGTVVANNDVAVRLSPATWIEGLSAPWPDAAVAGGRKKITKSSEIRRITIQKSALLWHSDFHEANASKELAAIEGAK